MHFRIDHALGHFQDIVFSLSNAKPIGGSDNPWWMSVLEWGKWSPYAKNFDIDWSHPKANGKLIVPILARSYQEALAAGDFELRFWRSRWII